MYGGCHDLGAFIHVRARVRTSDTPPLTISGKRNSFVLLSQEAASKVQQHVELRKALVDPRYGAGHFLETLCDM